MFALSAVPLMLLIGLAVDFGFIAQARAQLDLAADTAALTAARTAGSAFAAKQPNEIAVGQLAGVAWFKVQAGAIPDAQVSANSPVVTVTADGNTFTAVVTYQATVTTIFHKLFNVNFVTLANSATAQIKANAYVHVTFLLDNSSSMLIAADPFSVGVMQSLTPLANVPSGYAGQKCAFACHWDSAGNDYYGLARKQDVPFQLRFDVVQQAVAEAISAMEADEPAGQPYLSAGIFTFNSVLTKIFPASGNQAFSTDLSAAEDAAGQIVTPVSVINDTNFPAAMAGLVAQSTAAGDGSSSDSPRKSLIIVTDGVQDWYSPAVLPQRVPTEVPGYSLAASDGTSYSGAVGPISSADCAAMKRLGYSVYVLYTTYSTTPALLDGNDYLKSYVDSTSGTAYDLIPNLQSCASAPTNFTQASDSAAIRAAMLAMTQAAISSGARLTR